MHVLIYEPIHTGHHLNWVRLLIEACSPYASRITFATTAACTGSPEFKQHLLPLAKRFSLDHQVPPVVTGPDRLFEGFRVARRAWTGLVEAVERNHPDHVFVAFADALLRAPLTMTRNKLRLDIDSANVEGIVIESPYAFRADLPLRRQARMFAELLGASRLPFGRLMLLTPMSTAWLTAHFRSMARRCIDIPDAVTPGTICDTAAARRRLRVPVNGRMIGCIGVLDARKGVDEFVSSFARAQLNPEDRLLLAGRASPEVIEAVARARDVIGDDRILLMNRTLSNHELDLAVSAVDVVSITYRFPEHVGMSSMLIRATAAGRPVLSMSKGWPGYITRKLCLGWIYPENPAERPQAIVDSLDYAADFVVTSTARDFVAEHSEANLAEMFTRKLRKRVAPNYRKAA